MLGVFVFMMFRRNKKTQQQQAQLQSKFGPGRRGHDEFRAVRPDRRASTKTENKVTLELSPGNTATVHRQAVTKIVEPVVAAEEPTVVPDDASSLTTEKLGAEGTDASAPVHDAPRNETPEETLRRLNDEGKKDS